MIASMWCTSKSSLGRVHKPISSTSYQTAPPCVAVGGKIHASGSPRSWYARITSSGDSIERYIIDTASGVRLDLDDPRPEHIRIEDVAGGLSKVCRFGAQPLEYYSVAQHALLVRRMVVEAGHPELALVALHHDSHEAYLCDIPSPLKSKICTATTVYDEICRRFDRTIAEAFGFEYPEKGSEEKAVI